MSAPFLLAYVCFASGILAGLWIHAPSGCLIVSVFCAALSLRSKRYWIALPAQMLLLALLGLLFLNQQNTNYDRSSLREFVAFHEMEVLRVRGVILQTPEISGDFWVLRLRITSIVDRPVDGVARLTVTGDAGDYPVAGDIVETYTRLRLPVNYGTEGSFDYERYLRKEEIHVLGTVKNAQLIRVVQRTLSPVSAFSFIRKSLVERIRRTYSGRDAALLRALWLDDRAGLNPDTERALIDAGVFHVVAISGFHVAVVLAIGFFLLRRLTSYRAALLVLGILLLFYFFLLEGRSAITRSFLLFLAFAFAALRYEKIPWGNALGLAALTQLALNPLDLFDAGYHLTYLSTAGILFLGAPICRRVRMPRKVYRYLFDFVITTLSVQVVLAPYQAWTFHRVPFGALLANWIAVPASSVLIALGVGSMSLPFLDWLWAPVIRIFIQVLMRPSFLLSGCWLWRSPAPLLAVVCAYYAFLILLLLVRTNRLRLMCGVMLLVCFAGLTIHPRSQKDTMRVHVIDVGQGDAILLEYPDGVYDLVDGGGFWNPDALDVGASVVLPYFSRMGVTRLRYVFLTHAHADHMNGLFTILRYLPAERVYVTRRPYGEGGFQRLSVERLFDLQSLKKGDVLEHAGARLSVLAPNDSRAELHVRNDDSLVMLLEYEGHTVLLTGDAEKATEAQLAACCARKIDVMKVPHHGSRTSSTEALLAATRPYFALVSVGRNNWFGHPHPDVISRYRLHHVILYRTDRVGTIRLTLGRSQLSLDTFAWSR